MSELREILTDDFGFSHVTESVYPTVSELTKTQHILCKRLDLAARQGKKTLLFVYYRGNGGLDMHGHLRNLAEWKSVCPGALHERLGKTAFMLRVEPHGLSAAPTRLPDRGWICVKRRRHQKLDPSIRLP